MAGPETEKPEPVGPFSDARSPTMHGTRTTWATLVLALATVAPGAAVGPPAFARAGDRAASAPEWRVPDILAARAPDVRPVRPRPPSDLPLGHWAYPLLERLVARGVLTVDLSTRPVPRSAVVRALRALPDPNDASPFSASRTERERWALERLSAEFLGGGVDVPAVSLRDGDAVIALGVLLGTEVRYDEGREAAGDTQNASPSRGDDEPLSAAADITYEFWGGLGNAVGFYSDATILMEGQEGPRTVTLSKRARTWRGFAVAIDHAYVKMERPHLSVAVGRRGPAWGRSARGQLLISGAAPTFDQIDASFVVGPLGFYALHAMLEYDDTGTETALGAGDQVFLAGHRVTCSWRAGGVGLNEVVVYSSTIPEPAYLNPFLPYYVSQHNERANDNVLWSTDFTWRPLCGLELYGEFLVDDLQYDRNTNRPDKYAFTLGQTYYSSAAGFDYEIVAEYSHARKWTYTHGRVEHRYAHDGRPIGFDLGPDADRAILEIAFHPSPVWSVGLGYERSRKGEGTIKEAFDPADDSEPAFPSGNVLTTRRLALEVTYDDLAGFSYGLGAAYGSQEYEDGGSGGDEDGWEVWVGAEFRI
jgi:hypothetical protein